MNNKQKMSFFSIVFSILLFINFIAFSGCLHNLNSEDDQKIIEIYYGTTTDISGFYPWNLRDLSTCSLNQNFFNPLIEFNQNRTIIPALAKNWYNPNNLTWRFILREDVTFHNGDRFSAEDVNFTLRFLENSTTFYQERLRIISEIKIIDNYTIDIITHEPAPLLLYDFLFFNILSKKYIENLDDITSSYSPIGTGPYRLMEYIPGENIILERFDDYWNALPQIEKVHIIILNSNEEKLQFLLDKKINISMISFNDLNVISNSSFLTSKSIQTLHVSYLGFDFRVNNSYGFPDGKNPTANRSVRKAIYHAINIEEFIDKHGIEKNIVPASQFVTPDLFGYNPNISRLSYDLEKAQQYMSETDYKDGFSITLDCINSTGEIYLTNRIAEQLSLINISVTINLLTDINYYSKIYYKNTSFYLSGIFPLNSENLIETLLYSSNMKNNIGIWNYGNYSNQEIDRLSDKIKYNLDTKERKELIQQVFKIAMDDVAWVPLFTTKAFYGLGKNIIWNPRPSLYVLFSEISVIQ